MNLKQDWRDLRRWSLCADIGPYCYACRIRAFIIAITVISALIGAQALWKIL